jgi:hypothetical protein
VPKERELPAFLTVLRLRLGVPGYLHSQLAVVTLQDLNPINPLCVDLLRSHTSTSDGLSTAFWRERGLRGDAIRSQIIDVLKDKQGFKFRELGDEHAVLFSAAGSHRVAPSASRWGTSTARLSFLRVEEE